MPSSKTAYANHASLFIQILYTYPILSPCMSKTWASKRHRCKSTIWKPEAQTKKTNEKTTSTHALQCKTNWRAKNKELTKINKSSLLLSIAALIRLLEIDDSPVLWRFLMKSAFRDRCWASRFQKHTVLGMHKRWRLRALSRIFIEFHDSTIFAIFRQGRWLRDMSRPRITRGRSDRVLLFMVGR